MEAEAACFAAACEGRLGLSASDRRTPRSRDIISGVIHSKSESVSTLTSMEYISEENDEFIDANI